MAIYIASECVRMSYASYGIIVSSKKWFKSAEGIPIKMNEANKDSAQQCIDLATRALRVGTPPIALKSTAMLC